MKRAGRWILIAGLVFLFLSTLVSMLGRASYLFHAGDFPLGLHLLHYLALSDSLAITGGALWLAGWIVEGFGKEPIE